ncbi:MAG: DUF1232 domain-containing protein [Atopobiaceae bacterium]|nr:DUF1232 domain-containing protein [Atopobiaceae bacterium]
MDEQFDINEAKRIIEGGIAQAQEILSDPAKMDELFVQLQQKVTELPSTATEALSNIPLMASMVKGYVTGEYAEVSTKVVASLVSAFVYFVAQKDLISDKVPVVGLVDDLAVLALVMKLNEAELEAYRQWRDNNGMPDPQIEV